MKTVREVMTTEIIHVSPSNKIKTAIILMKGHNIGGLPVIEEDRVVGMIDYHVILGKDNDIPIQNVMDKEFVSIPPHMSIADAADLMTKINTSRLLVMDTSQLTGIVTIGDLLPELGKSLDPITGLPRADAMRDWGISALKRGVEITVIFFDLDNFGQFNKKYGHIVGDEVLKYVSNILSRNIDKDVEMLCRYAGDEFIIVTLRNAEDANELASRISEGIKDNFVQNLPEQVTTSFGVHGGKRTKEREDIHYNATLDNLINLASKSCTQAKEHLMANLSGNGGKASATAALQEAADTAAQNDASAVATAAQDTPQMETVSIEETTVSQRRLKLRGLNFSWDDGCMATVTVELVDGEFTSRQSCTGYALGKNALRLVADATAHTVSVFLPTPGYGIAIDSVDVVHSSTENDIVLVSAVFVSPQGQLKVSGSAIVKQDIYRAVAASVLNAINRQISIII